MKAIYGLEKAHLQCHKHLCFNLKAFRFVELPSARCIFSKMWKGNINGVFVLVYVHDLLVLSHMTSGLNYMTESLKRAYIARCACDIDWFLGVKSDWFIGSDGRSELLLISQLPYIERTPRRTGMDCSKPVSTPMVGYFWRFLIGEGYKAVIEQNKLQEVVGFLLYLTFRTQMDILAPVSILARVTTNPTSICHAAIKRVFRYLRKTEPYGITFTLGEKTIFGFVHSIMYKMRRITSQYWDLLSKLEVLHASGVAESQFQLDFRLSRRNIM